MRFIALAFATLILPNAVFAHAFGAQFTLPLPVNYYIFGGLSAFIASCAVLLFFSRPLASDTRYGKAFSWTRSETLRKSTTAISSTLFVFFISLGFFGPESHQYNPLPNLFWIIFLLLFAYVAAVIGGLWRYFDPFMAISELLAPRSTGRKIPEWLHFVPSALLFALLWLELFSHGAGASPRVIASVLLVYTILCVAMSRIYGTDGWFEKGELFTNFFAVFSKAAPIQIHDHSIAVLPPGERPAHESAPHEGVLLFICILLGSTILDGLRETMLWWNMGYAIYPDPRVIMGHLSLIALFLIPYLLVLIYTFAIWAMKKITLSELSTSYLILRFAYSLVPIAIAYHFAHYFSLILSQGQIFVAQISDPFDRGWDIFNTSNYISDPGLIGADTVWYMQLCVIIGGHILAAVIAHRISRRIFRSTSRVVVSQLPMLVLMVLFTAFGLWTLAQPFAV